MIIYNLGSRRNRAGNRVYYFELRDEATGFYSIIGIDSLVKLEKIIGGKYGNCKNRRISRFYN